MFDTSVPIPSVMPRNNRYNFHKMDVGVSFAIDFEPVDVQRLRVAACNYGRRNGKKFSTRKVQENGDWKLRVWREV